MISLEQEINHLLATITSDIRQSVDIKTILESTVQKVRRIINCDRVVIYRFDSNRSGKIVAESICNEKWSSLSNIVCNPYIESSWIDRYQTGTIIAYENLTAANVRLPHKKLLEHFNIKASLTAPILWSSNVLSSTAISDDGEFNNTEVKTEIHSNGVKKFQLWGLIIAHQCQKTRKWSELEKNLFQQLADRIAIAAYQANLLQHSDRQIKEKKLAEKETKQVKKFLQNVIERLPIAVYVKDASKKNFGQFQLWNRATEEIYSIKASEVLGKTVSDYFSSEQVQRCIEQDLEAIETKKAIEICEEHTNTDGQLKMIHKVKVPLWDGNQQPQHLLCIAEDITERKQAEQELKQKSEELAAFSQNLKLLHRLNTTNYQNFTELFKDHLQTGCRMFNCSTGVVGLIEGENFRVYAVESDVKVLFPNQTFPLKETLCLEVVKTGRTITYQHISQIEALCSRQVYKKFKFESYIGTPIFIDGAIFGTLSFTSHNERNSFSDREKETIEMMAQSIGRFILADRVEKQRQETAYLLNQTKKELEIRVLQRTAELEIANYHLQSELYERQQAQFALQASKDSLRESERRWRSLLESVRLLVVGINNQGNINYVNPYFLELTGYSKAEVLEQNWFDRFVHPLEKTEARKAHLNIIQEKYRDNCCHIHHYYKIRILNKLKEVKTIALNITQLCDLQGNPIGMMCIGEDITKRQAIEQMKDEFISVVSHELRTPLTSIRGALGLLATGVLSSDSEKGARIVKIAADSTEHLVRLVDDILELERLDSGKIELVIEKIKLQELISQAVSQVRMFAIKHNIEIRVTELEGEFYGDSDRLVRVLINLLSNGIKFSEDAGKVTVDAWFEQDKNDFSQSIITFSVSDRGRGIPANKLETIFERFHQVDASDSREKEGTGLGLAICRSIVEQHGGKIWVESVYGEGATFYFNLPVFGENL